VSDTAFSDPSTDRVLPLITEQLESTGSYRVKTTKIVPDEPEEISKAVTGWIEEGIALILTSGGTGFGTRDRTPEVCCKHFEGRPMTDEAICCR
jgi:gephyrin